MQQRLPTSLIPFFKHFLGKQKVGFVLLFVTMVGWPINEMVIPYIINQVVDILSSGASKSEVLDALTLPLSILVGMLLMNEVFLRCNDYLAAKVIPQFRTNITMAMVEHAKGHSHRYFMENFAGSISSKVTKLAVSMGAIMGDLVSNFFPVTASFAIGMLLMYQIDPIFSGMTAVWFIVQMGAFWCLMRKCQRLSEYYSEAESRRNGIIVDLFNNITSMRLFARNRYENAYLQTYQQEEQKRSETYRLYLFKIKMVFGLISITMMLSWWSMVLYQWYFDAISLGDVTQLLMQQWALTGLIWWMGMQLMRVYEEIGTCQEALSIIRDPYEINDAADAAPLTLNKGKITFERVGFEYQDSRAVFSDKNITIQAGQKVGLVGFSGSGKSTFVNLILRLYDLQSGRILIDGQDIAAVTRDSLRDHIAMIPQDPTLFHRTLRDNIRYGKLDATDADIEDAAAKAYASDFISELPDGYEALVGERGVKLSGGQRQRIAIARAILKDAPILILDEATSSLDSVSEQRIQKSLHTLMQDRTVIAIAHRLSTLADMDRILVFDQGKIIEDGSHRELLAAKGHYAKLWEQQVGGFLP